MRVVYAGFDGLDVAFMGALPERVLLVLEGAKEAAQVNHQPELVKLGEVVGHVPETGAQGGYRYRLDTGPEGETWFFKRSRKRDQWNIRVSVKSAQLAIHGWRETRSRLYTALEEMGATVMGESIGRVDFAVDVQAPDFRLVPEQFIASWQTRRMVHHNEDDSVIDPTLDNVGPDQAATVAYVGPCVSTVTLGKMPGRQIQVYDKRREVIDRALHKAHWWDIWGLDRHDPDARVWRVEIRAGKDHLKDRGVTTWADFEEKIGTLFLDAMQEVRYVMPDPADSNRSRWGNHDLWEIVSDEVSRCLDEHKGAVQAGHVVKGHRERLRYMYESLIKGLTASYSVAAGEADPQALSDIVGAMIRDTAASKEFRGKRDTARKRLIFIEGMQDANTCQSGRCPAEKHGWTFVRKTMGTARESLQADQLPEQPYQAPF